jgi:hypothetical protein
MEMNYLLGGIVFVAVCYFVCRQFIGWLYGANLESKLDAMPEPMVVPPSSELKKMTKAKLEEFGRDLGVELDKRKTKDNMIKELIDKVGK